MEFRFNLDDKAEPWLAQMKIDFTFNLKDNLFDDHKAYIINDMLRIIEDKLTRIREQQRQVKETSSERLKPTKEQIENAKLYKKKAMDIKDCMRIC